MNFNIAYEVIFRPAYTILPAKMNSPEATRQLLTIGMQESRFKYRVQLIGNHRHWWESLKGPARGWPQFEKAGIRGVLHHHSSRDYALDVLDALRYPADVNIIHNAAAHNDVLACCFARLLLWTDPRPLPSITALPEEGWNYYLRNWRPGKPHVGTWTDFWHRTGKFIFEMEDHRHD